MTSTRVVLFLILANKNLFIQKSSQFYVISPNTKYGNGLVFYSNGGNPEFKSSNFGQRMLGNFFECPGCWIKCRTICTKPPVIGSVDGYCHDKCYAPCCGCTPTDPCINGWNFKIIETLNKSKILGPIIYTLLKVDLQKYVNDSCSSSRCWSGTFPWRKCTA